MSRTVKRLARGQIDNKLTALQSAAAVLTKHSPRGGWLKGIRSALEISASALGRKLGVAHSTVLEIEKNEIKGSITLASLRKAADALDADLIYAVIPRKKLAETVSRRARELAKQQVMPIAHSMALEKQQIAKKQIKRQIEELARQLEENPRELWQ